MTHCAPASIRSASIRTPTARPAGPTADVKRVSPEFCCPLSSSSPDADPRRGSNSGAGADFVGDLALQELAVAEAGVKLAILDDDFAAQDRHARPGGDFVALPWRVVGLVQIFFSDHAPGSRVEQYDVRVGAERPGAFARIETHDVRGLRGGQ